MVVRRCGLFLNSTLAAFLALQASLFDPGPALIAAEAPAKASSEVAPSDAAQRLADRIDALIEAQWAKDNITPAPVAEDAEFLRRASLDLCGRIPAGSEVRDFMADASPAKRRAAIDRMLDSPTYIVHATNRWREAMLPEADSDDILKRIAVPTFESWLRSRIAENRDYAEIVREILTLPVEGGNMMEAFNQPDASTPEAFYRAKQAKPENLGAATSRLFLGVRLECAQCHDHPFDKWKRDEFWSYAAFFSEFQQPAAGPVTEALKNALTPDKHSLKIPDTEQVVNATYLGGPQPEWTDQQSAREKLADWITSSDNPWFARAAANRVWAQMFGQGIVEPVDDFGANNPPSHPEVLDELAKAFVENRHDLRFLARAIALSKTYQRTSRRTDLSQDAPRTFARMSVRAMSPEQIFDSLAQATGRFTFFDPEQPLNFSNDPARQEFLETFTNDSESTVERQSTILQALTLMNGSFVASATDIAASQSLTAVIEAPFLNTPERIEALFLAALSRPPHADELSRFQAYVDSGGPEQDSKKALADVFWALLNSNEFALNH
ncbi:hypothetical protein Pan44_18410 [Caulifigura coniformis]|uniref:Cytochrome c domain-containing protein n=1 Tax=Caulifigura coniformis TaxID=2527983 RepID=A0A517SCG5_9PLAN|nr:DUF1549 and DUF1553 domain-containing protein [Caulifigura coniformis]QDT53817.1 hypothetical protein Pan44_18410 [Caulifigura coniformis]